MALTRRQKTAQLDELTKKMKESSSVMFTHYIGLNVSDISTLRAQLRKGKAEMKVAKKNLIRLAAKGAGGLELTEDMLAGDVACIFSSDDPVTGGRIAHRFSRDHKHVQIMGGIFDGRILTKTEAVTFASLPSRKVLLCTFASMLSASLRSFAQIISSPMSGFARGLSELAKKKSSAPTA